MRRGQAEKLMDEMDYMDDMDSMDEKQVESI